MPVENLLPVLVSSWAVHKESFFQTLNGHPVDMATENFCQGRDTGIGLERCSLMSFPTLESYCKSQKMAGRELKMSVLSTGLVRKKLRKTNPDSSTGVQCHIFTSSSGLMFTGREDVPPALTQVLLSQ